MKILRIKCPVCSNEICFQRYKVREYVYYSCRSCGMLFLADEIAMFRSGRQDYDLDYFSGSLKDGFSGYMDYQKQSRVLRLHFRRILSIISRYMSLDRKISVLDVGCAYGFFLDEARKLGLSVHGLDLSKSAIDWMQENLGIKGTVGSSGDAPDGSFDLITIIEVLEHVSDPGSFLKDLADRMKRGGILVIHTGANDSLVAKVLNRKWWYLNPPDHFSIFSRVSLRKIVWKAGFQTLEHYLSAYHWVGLNNMLLKYARMFESRRLATIASKLPAVIMPVVHDSSQLLIGRKG